MKRRLTVSILLVVAAALLLAGVGTLLLARVGAKRAAEDELRSQAETTAILVAFEQAPLGELSATDFQALRSYFCGENPPPGATPQARLTVERLRAVVCDAAPSTNPVVAAERQLCGATVRAIEVAMTDEMKSARAEFCRNPDTAALDQVQATFCQASEEKVANTAAGRRVKLVREQLCRIVSVRNENRQDLRDTLSKESIQLVVFGPDNNLVQGNLPNGVTEADVQPALLRLGESVSGPCCEGGFAASAIDPGAESLSVIVIARPSDPVKGLVPWFLLASGITLAIGVVVANSLSRKLTQPLRDATAATARIADGDLSVRLIESTVRPNEPSDELDALAHAINAMAEALERSRGLERQFLLSVSHDLRTPLTSIRGYAEAIADGAAPDVQGAAAIILAESRRLERLVKDLLDLAKLDARRFTFHFAATDLNETAGDSVDGFRREAEAAGLEIELVTSPASAVAFTDPDRLQQVMANLVENALKYAGRRITVRVVGDAPEPRIEVDDDGPGIAAEDLPHVFERLYVASATPQRKETGSGLGLAIVRELVEAMGGRVHAVANPAGAGTRMVVVLPTVAPVVMPATPPAD